MATISAVVRWADNTGELTRNLKEGLNQIEATRASAEKLVQSLSGDKLIASAHRMVAAITEIGGATKLTAGEQERANALLTKAIEKYESLGKQAPDAMRQLAEATKATQAHTTAWGDYVSNFDIKAALTDPVYAAKSAVTALGSEMGALVGIGAAVVAGIGAVAAAAFALAKNAAAVGGQLNDMSEKTGLSVPALSRLSNAAQVAGSSLETLTSATFKLQKGIGEDSENVSRGLAKIGLTIDQLKAAGPDHYLELIAAGLKSIEDPAQRAAADAEIFKDKTGELLPVLLKLSDAMEQTADITLWTEQQAADAEHFEMQLESLKVHAEALAVAIGRDLIPYVSGFVSVAVDVATWTGTIVGKLSGLTSMVNLVADAWSYGAAAIRMFRQEAEKIPKVTGDAANGVKAWMKHVSDMGTLHVPTLTEALDTERAATKTLTESINQHGEAQKRAEAAARQYAEAHAKVVEKVRELEVIMPGLRQKVGEFDSTEKDSIETHLKNVDALEKLRATLRALQRDDFASVTEGLEKIGEKSSEIEQVRAYLKKVDDASKAWRNSLHEIVNSLTQLAQVAGDSFGGILKEVAQIAIAWEMAAQAADNFRNATTAAGKAAALAQGAVAVASATDSSQHSRGGAIAGGALTGAQMGAAIGSVIPGLGTAAGFVIGGVVGAIIGYIRSRGEWSRLGADIGREFGVNLSKETLKAWEAESKVFGRQATTILHLREIIEAAGGLTSKNLSQMTAKLHDVFSMIETHQLTIEQGTKVLDDNWSAFVEAGTDGVGLLDTKLVELIRLQAQFGTQSKAIAEYVKGQLAGVAAGFNAVAIAIAGPMSKVADLTKEQIAKLAIDSQEAFDRTARLAVVAFSAAITSGQGFLAAIDAIGPGLDALAAAMEKLGLQGSATLNQLLLFRKFAQENKELVAGIDGLNQMMTGLANSGMLTQDVFDDLSATAFDFYQKAIKGGLTSTQALVLMQPTLQRLWQLHKDNGLAIDENTQKILDEAEANGIVGDAMRSTNEKMLQVLVAIAKVLGADLPDAFDAAKKAAEDTLGKITIPTIKIKVEYDIDSLPDGTIPHVPSAPRPPAPVPTAHTGAMVTADGLQRFHRGSAKVLQFHRGGLAPDEVPAILQTGESVLNRQATATLGEDAIGALNRGVRGAASGVAQTNVVTVYLSPTIYVDGDKADADHVSQALDQAMRSDTNAIRTKIERVAVKAVKDAA